MKNQMTGNAGSNYVAWQLSRRDFNVMQTMRNAKGADIIAYDDNENAFFIQSKAISKRHDVPLGKSLESLRSQWWIITMHALSDLPRCFVLTLDEVKALASRDKGGDQAYWLKPRDFEKPEFEEAWERLS